MLALPPAPAAVPDRQAPPRVLVIDDDADMRALVADALSDAGFAVDALQDAADALCWQALDGEADAFVPGPELIVTDLRMARLDGLELLAAVRASGSRVPIVVISAFADDELRARALDLGANAVLAKPFSLRELLGLCLALCPLGSVPA